MKKVASPSPSAVPVARMVEDIVGCKWSIAVLALVRSGVQRPGAMEHAIDGLSAKVLNERLRKLMRFGILAKRVYPEVPPRVEYELTRFGSRFSAILDAVDTLQAEVGAALPGQARAPISASAPAPRAARRPSAAAARPATRARGR
jgi:DNA-binding HxlR family transcriptional regulator